MDKADQFPQYFQKRPHGVRPLKALINISAFKENVETINNYLDQSELIAVVKADAYGHGLVELSKEIPELDLAVAIPEELIQLRLAGVPNRVWVLEGFFSLECLRNSESVIWVIHSIWQLELLRQYSRISKNVLDICIKLDTGMHRLGFSSANLGLVHGYLNDLPQLNLVAVMSHFSMSDEPDNPDVYAQISKFDELIYINKWSGVAQTLANSGGISFYPKAHRSWVRPGIMLYGVKPSHAVSLPFSLKPVMSLQSAIIALHEVSVGETVGYGAKWQAKRDSVIATVAIGYADGYPRHAPNGTPVAVFSDASEAVIVELVGRVSMDMITIDVTGIEFVRIGTTVELWGDTVSVDQVADLSATISYELLTSVSKRVPRVYQNQ